MCIADANKCSVGDTKHKYILVLNISPVILLRDSTDQFCWSQRHMFETWEWKKNIIITAEMICSTGQQRF